MDARPFAKTVARAWSGLVTAAGLTLSAHAQPSIRATPAVVEAGQSATLAWSADGDAAFLTGVGKVAPSGSRTVAPVVPTDYVLIVQQGDRIDSAAVRVDVTGARGTGDFPDVDDFSSPPIVEQRRNTTFPDFLDVVHKTLQDTLSFHVRGDYLPKRPYITLYTDKNIRPELVRPEDRGIRRRRLAYAVRVNEPSGGLISYEIRTIVEYQRAAETQWRAETDTGLVRAATDSLRSALAGRPGR